ncbi:MAG: ankyrin repeat domain-containing protein [Rickettsiales bacterium]|nr:ankyrin repeat domain-containing protein [Rickettsiales bacterium]
MNNELNSKLLEICESNSVDALKQIKSLVTQGADVNVGNHSNSKALHIASQNNNFELVEFLLKNAADVNLLNDDGWTALHFAAQRGYTEIVKLLIKSGVKIDIQGLRYHRTALHYAADQGRLESVVEILKAGGKTDIRDIHKNTPLDIARNKNHQKIVEVLS